MLNQQYYYSTGARLLHSFGSHHNPRLPFMSTPCYFCSDLTTKYDKPALSKHLIAEHHFREKSFLIVDLAIDRAEHRIILPESPGCPIPGCKAMKLSFTNDSLGSHLRKTHAIPTSFSTRVREGYYFSWRKTIKKETPVDKIKSPAFLDQTLREAAWRRFEQPSDANLDPNDDAYYENEQINDLDDEIDFGDMTEAMSREMYTNAVVTDEGTSTTPTYNPPIRDPHVAKQMLPNIPHLICPPPLLSHGFALLGLPDFQDQPTVPVCIHCQTVINSKHFKALQEHKCAKVPNNAQPADDAIADDINEDQNAMVLDENDILPLDSDAEPDAATHSVSQAARIKWRPVREYYEENQQLISPLTSFRPSIVIDCLPFFPVEMGYGCPAEGCPRAFNIELRAREHAKSHNSQNRHLDHDYGTPKCRMQTIYGSTYFKVHDKQAPAQVSLTPVSISAFVSSSLRSSSELFVQGASSPLSGLSHRNPFMKRFDYQCIYPASLNEYKQFVASKVPPISPVYNRHQARRHHILALTSLVYHMDGCHRLGQGDDLTRRQLGNKLKSEQIGTQPRGNSFKPLQRYSSVVTYSAFFASFIAYALDVHADPSVDPDLVLWPEHQTTASSLLALLDASLADSNFTNALKLVKNISNEEIFTTPPVYFRHVALQGVVLAQCLKLQEAFHDFAFSLIKYPRHIRPTQSIFATPLNRFLALRAWNTDLNVFRDVVPLHNQMAHMQWSMRLVVYQEYVKLSAAPHSVPYNILCSLKDDCASQDATTPFGMLQDQLRYASALTLSVTVAPDATWDDLTQTAHLNEVNVPRHKFKEMLHTLVKQAYHILDKDIFFDRRDDIFTGRKNGIATFDRPDSLRDIPNAVNEGYSYFRQNLCFEAEREGLANLLEHDPALQKRFIMPYLSENKLVWNLAEVHRYVDVIDKYKSILACLVYWLSGMPPRGTEFTGTLIYNNSQRRRNIICSQGDLVMEHNYTKSESSTGFGRPVMRLPAHQLQRLLEEYIVVVKPVYDSFVLLLKGDSADRTQEYHNLLWTYDGHEMTPAELSKSLRGLSMEYLGFAIGLRSWRQIMIQFSTYILPLEIRTLALTTYVLTAQASHGQAAEDKNYNRQTGITFEQVCSSQFGEYQRASLAWVEAFEFPHPRLRSSLVTPGTQPAIDSNYLIKEISANVIASTKAMREEDVKERLARQIVSQVQTSPLPCRFVPLDIPVSSEALDSIKALYPNVQSFRSPDQAMCIEYARQGGATPLFVIHPMGHGKSSIYLAPMVKEKGQKMTVVVVPLLSLAQSAAANAKSLGFNAKFFNPAINNPTAKNEFLGIDLIVMTYDLLVANQRIFDWLHDFASNGSLSRVVIDEAHTIHTEAHYRTRFPELITKSSRLKVPLIFLSGTMPENVCHAILEAFQDHKSVYLSRLPSDRANLAYSVHSGIKASDGMLQTFCDHVCSELIPQLSRDPRSRAIIFTHTVNWANIIAATLGSRLFTGPADLEKKQQDLDQWLDMAEQPAHLRLLVGTSSISLGVDRKSVDNVYIFGDPFDSITFAQMAARAGRDNSTAQVVLFPCEFSIKDEEDTMQRFKSTVNCRRIPLSIRLDNRSVTCFALPSAAKCDNCLYDSATNPPQDELMAAATLLAPALSIADRDFQLTTTIETLYKSIKTLTESCPYCILSSRDPNHSPDLCPTGLDSQIAQLRQAVSTISVRKSIPGLAICNKCNMPQKAGNKRGMDLHAAYCDLKSLTCRLELPSLRIILGLLASKNHRELLLSHTDGWKPSQALEALLTPVTRTPCSRYDTGRQLLALHFIIISALSTSTYAGPLVLTTAAADWFKTFMPIANDVDNPASILDDIILSDYKTQFVVPQKRPMDPSTAGGTNSKKVKKDEVQSMNFD